MNDHYQEENQLANLHQDFIVWLKLHVPQNSSKPQKSYQFHQPKYFKSWWAFRFIRSKPSIYDLKRDNSKHVDKHSSWSKVVPSYLVPDKHLKTCLFINKWCSETDQNINSKQNIKKNFESLIVDVFWWRKTSFIRDNKTVINGDHHDGEIPSDSPFVVMAPDASRNFVLALL